MKGKRLGVIMQDLFLIAFVGICLFIPYKAQQKTKEQKRILKLQIENLLLENELLKLQTIKLKIKGK